MCRWMAWLGQPVLIEELLFKTQHGIVDQSLHARMGAEPTNGDGFGLGWYGDGRGPGRLPQRRAGLGRREPARARRAHRVAAVPRPRPRRDRLAGAADQLPPVPPRATGCSCTTATSPTSTRCAATSCSRSTPRCSPTSRARPTPRSSSTSRSRFGLEDDPIGALERTVGMIEATARGTASRTPVQGDLRRLRRRDACGRCATRPRAPRDRCSPRPTPTRSAACIRTTRASSASAPTTA